ncbi:LON peptidase N-terminal domain and RING finger protein 3, partial [Stegodyphus mimosarum]
MQCRDCSNFQSMGEFDLQASVSRSQTECENLESPVVGNVGKVDILGDLLKSNLKYGQVHEALNTCIRAYSSGFPDSNSQYLEILLDGVAKKARDKLYKNAKLSLLCSLCYGVLTDPVTLKCGHTFSKKCIVKAMKGDYFECVKCSKSYSCDYLIELRNNVIISTVLEKYWETKNSSIKKSVETSVQEQTQEKICDADMCFIANRSRKEPLSALVSESALFNSSSPMGYLRRGDLLVKLEKYEEALIAYLVCFTFDSKAMHARGK